MSGDWTQAQLAHLRSERPAGEQRTWRVYCRYCGYGVGRVATEARAKELADEHESDECHATSTVAADA